MAAPNLTSISTITAKSLTIGLTTTGLHTLENPSSSNKVFNDSEFSKNEYNWYFKAIGCHQAWEYTTGSDSVIIAVIDGNFDLNHIINAPYVFS